MKILIKVFALLILCCSQSIIAKQLVIDDSLTNQIERSKNILRSTGTDGFVIFDDQTVNIAELAGVEFEFELGEAIVKPELFELFWKTQKTGFNELHKVMFMLPASKSSELKTRYAFYLPLDTIYNFSGFRLNEINDRVFTGMRLDFPAKENVQITLKKAELVKVGAEPQGLDVIEPYERMSLHSKGKIPALMKKLSLGFDFGVKRFFNDMSFAVFWLLSLLFIAVLFILSRFRRS